MLMAAALGFHARVQRQAVLLRKVEASQLDVDHFDAVIAQRDLAAARATSARIASARYWPGSTEKKAVSGLRPIAAPSSANRMSPSLDSAPLRSNTVWKNFLGSLMRQSIVPAATTGVFSSVRNSVAARSESEQPLIERAHALVGIFEAEPGEVTTLTGLPNSVTNAYSPASTV